MTPSPQAGPRGTPYACGTRSRSFAERRSSSLLPSALSSFIDGAKDALKEKLNELNPAKEVMKDLKDWAKSQFEDWMPDASELERIEKDINNLLKDVETWGKEVVSDIGDTVQNALGSGQIPAQTDGGVDIGAAVGIDS